MCVTHMWFGPEALENVEFSPWQQEETFQREKKKLHLNQDQYESRQKWNVRSIWPAALVGTRHKGSIKALMQDKHKISASRDRSWKEALLGHTRFVFGSQQCSTASHTHPPYSFTSVSMDNKHGRQILCNCSSLREYMNGSVWMKDQRLTEQCLHCSPLFSFMLLYFFMWTYHVTTRLLRVNVIVT